MAHDQEKLLYRRAALRTLGVFAAAALVACNGTVEDDGSGGSGGSGGAGGSGGSGGSAGAGGSGGTTTTTGTGSTTCAATNEGEIGPYFADDSAAGFNRSDLRSNIDGTNTQEGIALALTFTIVDTQNDCAPYADAQVDIWSCNAKGVYSDEGVESTTGETWLRGYQKTDAKGQVTFTTIIPGWYQGRTTHIHVRVRSVYSAASSTSDGSNTTQIFFDQDFVDNLATNVDPYNDEGINETTNASDRVYAQQTDGKNELKLSGSVGSGYQASFAIGLPITS